MALPEISSLFGRAGEAAGEAFGVAAETVEWTAYMEVIDEMPIVGDLWEYTPATMKNGFEQPATWDLTDKGRSVALWGAIGAAAILGFWALRR